MLVLSLSVLNVHKISCEERLKLIKNLCLESMTSSEKALRQSTNDCVFPSKLNLHSFEDQNSMNNVCIDDDYDSYSINKSCLRKHNLKSVQRDLLLVIPGKLIHHPLIFHFAGHILS